MPWRDEDNLKGIYHTFQEKYLDAESTIKPNNLKHSKYFEIFDIDDDIVDNHYDYSSSNDNNSDDDDYYENEFTMLNPDLLDYDSRDENNRANDEPVGAVALLQFLMLPYLEKFSMTCVYSSMKASKICLIPL